MEKLLCGWHRIVHCSCDTLLKYKYRAEEITNSLSKLGRNILLLLSYDDCDCMLPLSCNMHIFFSYRFPPYSIEKTSTLTYSTIFYKAQIGTRMIIKYYIVIMIVMVGE
jgi:hypothetical protein